MFGRSKKLFECDPGTLSIEMLSQLQAALIAKLITVNAELKSRWQTMADLSADMPNTGDPARVLSGGAAHLGEMNKILEAELARIAAPADTN